MSSVRNALSGRIDATIAVGLLGLGLIEALLVGVGAPLWRQVPLTFVWAVPLAWRRRWPVMVLALVIAMGPTLGLVNEQGGVMSFVLAAIMAAYTVGRELDAPATWWGPALTVGFGWVVFAATDGMLSDFVFVAVLYGGAWAVGHTIRHHDLRVDHLTLVHQEERRQLTEKQARAVERERIRIARELHDIVSHSISVIAIQVQAVQQRLGPENGEIETLQAIESAAREAMGEMRRLLGVLRAQGEAVALAPQPGLAQLPQLIEGVSATGLVVHLEVEGEAFDLAMGIDLTSYRIIQEALTNVCRHSTAKTVEVLLRYEPDVLEITIEDGGPRLAVSPDAPVDIPGHGLAGMRERVMLYGGRVTATPRPQGGFLVQAWLPVSNSEAVSY